MKKHVNDLKKPYKFEKNFSNLIEKSQPIEYIKILNKF
jgi:hypothetical protein